MNDMIDLSSVQPITASSLVRPRSCVTCEFGVMEGKDRVCRANPPQATVIAVPVQQDIPGPQGMRRVQGMQMQVHAVFPPVQDGQWCGRYAAKGSH